MSRFNVLRVGATRKGKTLAAARSVIETPDQAVVVFDWHKQSLAETVLTHARGNVLHANLSDLAHTIGFELLKPSTHPDPIMRDMENHQRAEAFVQILLRRRGMEGMASTPLMEEWVMAAIMLYLHQGNRE